MKRPKTKLRCTKCGYRWKEVVFTSEVLGRPPYCPKCARKGVRAVGKPVKVVPLRKRVKNLAKALVVKPVYYGALVPLKYTVLKPSLLGLRGAWWSLKMKLFLASLPFRALWWGAKLPYRVVEKVLAPPPKVIVLGEESGRTGFLGDGYTAPSAPASPGFTEDEDGCPECGEDLCRDCECCHECGYDGHPSGSEEEAGFLEEEAVVDSGRAGFARETDSGRTGFAPEESGRTGFRTGGFLA